MNEKKSFLSVQEMVEMSLLLALAVVLDIAGIKIGHASFTMVPLFILAYRHGFVKSFIIIAIAFSIINLLTDGYGFSPLVLLLDYSLAYGSISIASLFTKLIFNKSKKHYINLIWMVVSIVIPCALRLFFSTLSGVINYETPFIASLEYNFLANIGWDSLLAIITLVVLYPTLLVINKNFPTKNIK